MEDTYPTALVLRTNLKGGKSTRGFVWPRSGPVIAPDWQATDEFGHGLHGLLWGEGDGSLLDWSDNAEWMVVRVFAGDPEMLREFGGKVKFPSGDVVYVGDRDGATQYLYAHGGAGRSIHGLSLSTTGYRSAASTTGYRSAASTTGYGSAASTAGYGSAASTTGYGSAASTTGNGSAAATTGYRSAASTTGYGSAAATTGNWSAASTTGNESAAATTGNGSAASTTGYGSIAACLGQSGAASAGSDGVIALRWFDGKRVRLAVGYPGEGGMLPHTTYRVDDAGVFVVVEPT